MLFFIVENSKFIELAHCITTYTTTSFIGIHILFFKDVCLIYVLECVLFLLFDGMRICEVIFFLQFSVSVVL